MADEVMGAEEVSSAYERTKVETCAHVEFILALESANGEFGLRRETATVMQPWRRYLMK
jgi:hypothetical protein